MNHFRTTSFLNAKTPSQTDEKSNSWGMRTGFRSIHPSFPWRT